MIGKNNKIKIVVAMSGGVDSSVAAALLKKQSYDVIGVHLKFWAEGINGAENRCCTPESEKRARLVAEKLNIPFYVFNFEKEFKKKVVDYFLKEYKAGRTPNPCVVCNKEIKFGLLLEKALKFGVDFVATGHYTRLRREFSIFNFQFPIKSKIPIYKLLKGKDKNKDQSYFLWRLNQKQLKHILFPVGDYIKEEVRKLAKKFKLPVADIPESQEICFIPDADLRGFLNKRISAECGDIVTLKGKIIGKHQGLYFYTIGQRKGIGLSGGPFYVLDKDIKKNLLIITQNEKDLYKKELIIKNVNWISGKPPKFPLKASVKIRYKHKPASATLSYYLKPNTYHLIFNKPQRAITPGQSAVFYYGTELLGGGTIDKVLCFVKIS